MLFRLISPFFFFKDPPTPEISPLSLPDALPIYPSRWAGVQSAGTARLRVVQDRVVLSPAWPWRLLRMPELQIPLTEVEGISRITFGIKFDRSEEHPAELQSPCNLVCRLLLAKKQ